MNAETHSTSQGDKPEFSNLRVADPYARISEKLIPAIDMLKVCYFALADEERDQVWNGDAVRSVLSMAIDAAIDTKKIVDAEWSAIYEGAGS